MERAGSRGPTSSAPPLAHPPPSRTPTHTRFPLARPSDFYISRMALPHKVANAAIRPPMLSAQNTARVALQVRCLLLCVVCVRSCVSCCLRVACISEVSRLYISIVAVCRLFFRAFCASLAQYV